MSSEANAVVYVPVYMSLVRSYEALLGQEAALASFYRLKVANSTIAVRVYRYGNPRFKRSESSEQAVSGQFRTNGFENPAPSNWARWNVFVEESAAYKVEVNVIEGFNVSKKVRYLVRASGQETELTIDQSQQSGWVELGEYDFTNDTSVAQSIDIFDNTGDTESDQHISADAVRLTPVTTPNPEPSVDMGDGSDMEGSRGQRYGGESTGDQQTIHTSSRCASVEVDARGQLAFSCCLVGLSVVKLTHCEHRDGVSGLK